MELPQFRQINGFQVDHGQDPEGLYRRHGTWKLICDFVDHLPAPDKSRELVGRGIVLINPILGNPAKNFIFELYENQLEWIAEIWKEICDRREMMFGDLQAVTPLTISGEGVCLVVREDGVICSVTPRLKPETYQSPPYFEPDGTTPRYGRRGN